MSTGRPARGRLSARRLRSGRRVSQSWSGAATAPGADRETGPLSFARPESAGPEARTDPRTGGIRAGIFFAPMLLRERDRAAVRDRFREIAGPVSIRLWSRRDSPLVVPGRAPCATCPTAEALLGEVAELSDQLRLQVVDADERREEARRRRIARLPTIELEGAAAGRVRFLGLPDGHEFGTLVGAAVTVSGAATSLRGETTDLLATLRHPVRMRVFTTPT